MPTQSLVVGRYLKKAKGKALPLCNMVLLFQDIGNDHRVGQTSKLRIQAFPDIWPRKHPPSKFLRPWWGEMVSVSWLQLDLHQQSLLFPLLAWLIVWHCPLLKTEKYKDRKLMLWPTDRRPTFLEYFITKVDSLSYCTCTIWMCLKTMACR